MQGEANPAFRHGHTAGGFSPTYRSWAGMVQRCTNPERAEWRLYGGRGITVCERWLEFDNFLADMGERPDGLTLDRVDNDKGYEPGNCRWATRTTQARNSRAVRTVEIDGAVRSVAEWCDVLGVSRNTVQSRVRKWGYTLVDALTSPRQDRAAAARRMTETRMKG